MFRLLASNSRAEAEDLVRGLSNASTCLLYVEDGQKVSRLIEGADVVIRWVKSSVINGGVLENCSESVVSYLSPSIHPSPNFVSSMVNTWSQHHTYPPPCAPCTTGTLVRISPSQGLLEVIPLSAESANVVLLNEIGLDPGIDHCSALSLLRQLEKENKRVLSFISFCGGLPAPEASDVPLGYKFSWSPRGVLNAALNDARFKLNGEVRVPCRDLHLAFTS